MSTDWFLIVGLLLGVFLTLLWQDGPDTILVPTAVLVGPYNDCNAVAGDSEWMLLEKRGNTWHVSIKCKNSLVVSYEYTAENLQPKRDSLIEVVQ